MIFRVGETFDLPDVSSGLHLKGSRFAVDAIMPGGMGVCLKLIHQQSQNKYALKAIKPDAVTQKDAFARFLQEIRLWTSASACDGVVQVYLVTRINEIPCVCAEWMEGGNLRDRLRNRDAAFFYATMDRIIGALDWVYQSHKIIHRDIKPENILLDGEGRAFISDWGIGRIQLEDPSASSPGPSTSPHGSVSLTQTGTFIGTILYSAPEQILGNRLIDYRADMYSLGCLMHEWETGLPPFIGRTAEEIGYKHLESPVPSLGGLFKKTHLGAENPIARCLAKNPDNRFKSYSDLRSALLECSLSRRISINSYLPRIRHKMPLVGAQQVKQGFSGAILGKRLPKAYIDDDGESVAQYALVESTEIERYLREVDVLSAMGDWEKAADIYARLFVPKMITSLPDWPMHQSIAIGYGLCLLEMSKPDKAIEVMRTVSSSSSKPVEYFVNLSLALIHVHKCAGAEQIALEGLSHFPNDRGILGNLSIALSSQDKHSEAKPVAEHCLSLGRDVHSLEQVATIEMFFGDKQKWRDWPKACEHYARSLNLLSEAEGLNPRYLSVRFNLVQTLTALNHCVTALRELDDVAELSMNPAWAELWARAMTDCLRAQGDIQACLKFSAKWLIKFPDSVTLKRARAEATMELSIGRLFEGRRGIGPDCVDFFEAIILDGRNRRLTDFVNFARVAEWAFDDPKIAYILLDEAEKYQPGSWDVPFHRAQFLHRSGQHEAALIQAQKACIAAAWWPDCWNLVADIQKTVGMKTEGARSAEHALLITAKRSELSTNALESVRSRFTA